MFKAVAITCLTALLGAASIPASAADKPEPIRIGVLVDLGGPYADITGNGSVQAAKMAVEDFGGTLLGRPVEVLTGDHQNKSDVGSTIVRSWFDEDDVQAIFDLGNSAVGLAASQIATEKHRIVVGSGIGTPALTGEQCSPTTFQWTWDTYSNINALVKQALSANRKKWFILAADYAMGISLQDDATRLLSAEGGVVVGSSRPPLGNSDFSSYLLEAQSSGADVVMLANAGSDLSNTLKQAQEFGLLPGKMEFVAALMNITVVHAVGPKLAQGIITVGPFNWTKTSETRKFAQQLAARNNGVYPDWVQAGVYSSVLHYLKSAKAAGTLDADKVATEMRALPTDDKLFGHGSIRADNRAVHPIYVLRVKTPEQVTSPWDLFDIVATYPGEELLLPLDQSKCRMVRH